jgi:hypothetical protein
LADVEGLGRETVLEVINGVPMDVDAPIPYVLTARARRELQEWRDDEDFPDCPHEWLWDRGGMRCQNCTRRQPVSTHPAIPSYLGPKTEWKRR